MEDLDQLQKEWTFINATKEALRIFDPHENVTYADAIQFSKRINNELFRNSKTGLSRKTHLEKLYDKYDQESIAVTRETKRKTTAEDLIKKRIEEIKRLSKQFTKADDYERLKKERSELNTMIKFQIKPILGLEEVTENQAIIYDSEAARKSHTFVKSHLGKFQEFYNYERDAIFRVAVLHPNPSEAVTGTDLIYEQYNELASHVRIVALQYKVWQDGVLYFSSASNLDDQLKKMSKCFCEDNFCKDDKGNNVCMDGFRLPYCVAFLKPTDKLQNPKNLITSGLHVPVCIIDKLKTPTSKGVKLERIHIQNASLNSGSFEDLFNRQMIGSKWMKVEDLENFYQQSKVLSSSGKIVLYTQTAMAKARDKKIK
jgi:hypothetical protein